MDEIQAIIGLLTALVGLFAAIANRRSPGRKNHARRGKKTNKKKLVWLASRSTFRAPLAQ